jgi:hypothetical protein
LVAVAKIDRINTSPSGATVWWQEKYFHNKPLRNDIITMINKEIMPPRWGAIKKLVLMVLPKCRSSGAGE